MTIPTLHKEWVGQRVISTWEAENVPSGEGGVIQDYRLVPQFDGSDYPVYTVLMDDGEVYEMAEHEFVLEASS